MTDRSSPYNQTDGEARGIAHKLLRDATTAALAVTEADTGAPFVSRIGFGLSPEGVPMTLISDLALHSRALRNDPRAALLIGEAGSRGDPLTHPRLTIRATARFVLRNEVDHHALRAAWLGTHPKATLYVDFADFHFVLFDIVSGHLNAGFAKAYALDQKDLTVR
ncbi:pyridoxamine 5'-phosphate oxidase family protein [Defluviimonas aestuarii]|uniref:HugZ family pyridoxamine 5'-phosphate oxidase n=1 Tax=Albidovulum aestuarii TaxID=1130726 RepID=UPI00249BB88A|nr:pyridoxamine 5'-phosphate oxidase family protein [Defluviimonas aestuarii]MDI3337121.1 pyridoxamine 5'-phosphate oxidase family protein [Defluviimonas aestuarii]